jgi:GTP cyclohydrolase IIa
VITFLNPEDVDGALDLVSTNVKAGVGIGFTPRQALRNATKALTEIRKERKVLWKIVSGQ